MAANLNWTGIYTSDSLNVNELVQALYRGADYAAKSDGTAVNVDARSEADLGQDGRQRLYVGRQCERSTHTDESRRTA